MFQGARMRALGSRVFSHLLCNEMIEQQAVRPQTSQATKSEVSEACIPTLKLALDSIEEKDLGCIAASHIKRLKTSGPSLENSSSAIQCHISSNAEFLMSGLSSLSVLIIVVVGGMLRRRSERKRKSWRQSVLFGFLT